MENARQVPCPSCSKPLCKQGQRLAVPANGLGFEIHPSRKFFDEIPGGQ